MDGFWRFFFIAVATAAAVAGTSSIFRRSQPVSLNSQGGMIRPERWTAWITIIMGLLFCGSGFYFIFSSDDNLIGCVGIVLGTGMSVFMAPSVTSIHAVEWDANEITGPTKIFGLTLGRARTSIAWSDVAGSGKTITGYWYINTSDGRRVYWSYLYKGYGELTKAIRRHCPFLELPPDLK